MKHLLLLLFALLTAGTVAAKDIRTVVFKVEQMSCVNCEGKVKRNIPYETGVKNMKTNLEDRTVTVTFDAEKTSVERLQKGFGKFGYKAEVLKTSSPEEKKAETPKKK